MTQPITTFPFKASDITTLSVSKVCAWMSANAEKRASKLLDAAESAQTSAWRFARLSARLRRAVLGDESPEPEQASRQQPEPEQASRQQPEPEPNPYAGIRMTVALFFQQNRHRRVVLSGDAIAGPLGKVTLRELGDAGFIQGMSDCAFHDAWTVDDLDNVQTLLPSCEWTSQSCDEVDNDLFRRILDPGFNDIYEMPCLGYTLDLLQLRGVVVRPPTRPDGSAWKYPLRLRPWDYCAARHSLVAPKVRHEEDDDDA